MKYFLFFVIAISMSCSGPKAIGWDKTREDNIRHIGSKPFEINIGDAKYSFTLAVFSGSESKYYCLIISSIWQIENDAIVLLKLGNEENIKLTADNTKISEVDWPTYLPIIGGTTPMAVVTTKKANYYTSIYLMSQEVLDKIEQNGIYKLRIQYGLSYKEQGWIVDRLGEYIKKSHDLIERQLRDQTPKSSLIEKEF